MFPGHQYDIEAAVAVGDVVLVEIAAGNAAHLLLFAARDPIDGIAEIAEFFGFDLDENKHPVFFRDDIQLAMAEAIVALQNVIALFLEKFGGQLFAQLANRGLFVF